MLEEEIEHDDPVNNQILTSWIKQATGNIYIFFPNNFTEKPKQYIFQLPLMKTVHKLCSEFQRKVLKYNQPTVRTHRKFTMLITKYGNLNLKVQV